MILACLTANRIDPNREWNTYAKDALYWFLGQNRLNIPLYDYQTGGCCDGLSDGKIAQINKLGFSDETQLKPTIRQLRDLDLHRPAGRCQCDDDGQPGADRHLERQPQHVGWLQYAAAAAAGPPPPARPSPQTRNPPSSARSLRGKRIVRKLS